MTNKFHDEPYLELMNHVLINGKEKTDRTNTGTVSIFAKDITFDINNMSIPMLTTKKMFPRIAIRELLWYISGSSSIKYLVDNNVNIWNEWPFVEYLKKTNQQIPEVNSDEWVTQLADFVDKIKYDDNFANQYSSLGPVYGKMWRAWPHAEKAFINYAFDPPQAEIQYEYIDQLSNVIDTIKNNPHDRRIIVNSWNVGLINQMALPPCHYTFQFYCEPMSYAERVEYALEYSSSPELFNVTSNDLEDIQTDLTAHNIPENFLHCKLNMRSTDVFLGLPFNIMQYSILTHMVAQVTNTVGKSFTFSGGDIHIYKNHIRQCCEQLKRHPFASPTVRLNPDVKSIFDFDFNDITIEGYSSHNVIKAPVAV